MKERKKERKGRDKRRDKISNAYSLFQWNKE